MTLLRWAENNRVVLGEVLPEALVVLPVGAIEQHGPHLPTGTDTFAVGHLTEAATERAAALSTRDIVLAPALPFGASDHHHVYGATLSLSTETITTVLVELLGSVAKAGGRRVFLVNGHGGNRGPCHGAAQIASIRYGLSVGYADYWEALLADAAPEPDWPPVPGHAGGFESSVVHHLRPDLVAPIGSRTPPVRVETSGTVVHSMDRWREIDGYTDDPASASAAAGARFVELCVAALADRVVAMAAEL